MQLNVILIGSSIFILAAISSRLFYQQYLARKNQSLMSLSKWSGWVEPSIEAPEELLEESIADEIMSSVLPQTKNKSKATRETEVSYGYEVLTLYIMASPNRPFQGYELLQAISVNGFSYGKMRVFHRHEQQNNPNSPILFSLANAIEPGFFNLSEMGAFSCTGLILFMHIDSRDSDLIEQFYLMLDTANQLADDLGGEVLDDTRHLFDVAAETRYLTRLASDALVT